MKKTTFLLLVCAAMLCACNKSTTTPEQSEQSEQKEELTAPQLAKVETIADFGEISSDVLDYYKITFNLIDYLGNEKSYDITGPQTIRMTVENPVLEANKAAYKHTIELLFTKKDTPQKSEDKYDLKVNYDVYNEGTYPDGKIINNAQIGYRQHLNLQNSSFESFQDWINLSKIKKISYGFYLNYDNANGWTLGWDVML